MTHLKILQTQGLIDPWYDRLIVPGEDWDNRIREALTRANIFLGLVSANFLASDYIQTVEFDTAMHRSVEGNLSIIPVLVGDCLVEDTPLAQLQALPRNGIPIARAEFVDLAWKEIVTEIVTLSRRMR